VTSNYEFSPAIPNAVEMYVRPGVATVFESNQENHTRKEPVSMQAVARVKERSPGITIPAPGINIPKDNWLGFVGDVVKFSGEVTFKTSLRIDGKFSGNVNSAEGTLTISMGAQLNQAVINVAVAKINGSVEGDINARELILGRTAKVTGNLSARTLIIEKGAQFNGHCTKT